MIKVIFGTLLLIMSFNGFAKQDFNKKDTVLRYVIRSTIKGDTELLVNTRDGSYNLSRDVKKKGCEELWNTACFEKKVIEGKFDISEINNIVVKIKKAKLYESIDRSAQIPAPNEEQYSIALITEGVTPKYANLKHSNLNKHKNYNDIKKSLDKLIPKKTWN